MWNSPYLFNAKEFDEETGLYYYGARYYDPRLAMWLGVDALAEKYPNMGAYAYCANNPVKLVDPDGNTMYPFPYFDGFSFDFWGMLRDQFVGFKNTFYSFFAYRPERNNDGKVIIDNNEQAVEHYYRGKGESVVLGPSTQEAIKNSKDMNRYRSRIVNGETSSPASGHVPVDMTTEDGTYHVGRIPMSYVTTIDGDNCTTTYTISGDGFWDIFWGEDQKGSNGELGGTPYNYEPFSWSETYKNPGYGVSPDGKLIKIETKDENINTNQ